MCQTFIDGNFSLQDCGAHHARDDSGMKKDTILIRFSGIFLLFMSIIIILNACNTYSLQRESHKANIEKTLRHISAYLENLIRIEGREFLCMQDFIVNNASALKVPSSFAGDFRQEKEIFDTAFARSYPGRIFEKDVPFDALPFEMKLLFAEYMFRKWLAIFETAKEKFEIKYAYYLVPSKDPLHMYWVIDFRRGESRHHGPQFINICADVFEPTDEHPKMWEAWNTGKAPKGYDIYDNEYGKTYAYFTPLILEGEKRGVIGIEIDTAEIESAIFYSALLQILYMSMVTILCICALLYIINRTYLTKIENLQKFVNLYATSKDRTIAERIDAAVTGCDEISLLAKSISAMIHEISTNTATLKETLAEFYAERKRANALHDLAQKDALTGIKNKLAYDIACEGLARDIKAGKACFAIAVVDLNYLKRTNDTYGHERGNSLIKKVCALLCATFAHYPVFRIGGDEFAVIMKNTDAEQADALIAQFADAMRESASDTSLEPWERVSAAIGGALFNPAVDTDPESVFKRADKAMYDMKQWMKSEQAA